jgi:hypothetical protein
MLRFPPACPPFIGDSEGKIVDARSALELRASISQLFLEHPLHPSSQN